MFRTVLKFGTAAVIVAVASISGVQAEQKETHGGQPNTVVKSGAQADQKGTHAGQPNTTVKSGAPADQKGTHAGQPNTAVKSGPPADQKGTPIWAQPNQMQIVDPHGKEIANDHKLDGRVCVLGKEGGYNPDTGEFTTWPVLKCNDQ
jgi:hypothetical protein